jgi:hypothetical protein
MQHSAGQMASRSSKKGSSAFLMAEQTVRQKLENELVLRLLHGLDVLKGTNSCKISLVLYKYTSSSSKSRGRHYIVELNSKLVLRI